MVVGLPIRHAHAIHVAAEDFHLATQEVGVKM